MMLTLIFKHKPEWLIIISLCSILLSERARKLREDAEKRRRSEDLARQVSRDQLRGE